MLFVHEGTGVCRTVFGDLAYHPGDYLVLPIGTTWRLDPDGAPTSGSSTSRRRPRSSRPSATATTTGSSWSTRPTASATSRRPSSASRIDENGDFVIDVRSSDRITAYHYRHHPFDVVGWDGYLWPFRFDIADFQPITGRVHQPPPVHQTFQARNFVVCSFVPRKFDYHPLAIPAPYNHSNINSDEVIYYVAGNFMSRRGVDIASFTLHPAGIPHGPHPGTAEASIGKEATEELAVMVDTFHPLHVTQAAMDLDDAGLPVLVAAARGRRGPRARAVRARTRGVPGLTCSRPQLSSRPRVLGEVDVADDAARDPKSRSPRVRARMANASRSPRWACSTRSRSTRSALSVARIGCAVRAYRVISSRECSNFASVLGPPGRPRHVVPRTVGPGRARHVQGGRSGCRRIRRDDRGDIRPANETGVRQAATDRLYAVAGRPQAMVDDHAREHPRRASIGPPEFRPTPIDLHAAIVARGWSSGRWRPPGSGGSLRARGARPGGGPGLAVPDVDQGFCHAG